MNHGNFNGFDDWNHYFMQFSNNQEFVDFQPYQVGTSTNIVAAGSEMMLTDVTTEQILQHEVISTQIANNNTMQETSGNASGVDPAKREKKRKCDREYRQRCKENKKKSEEELELLRKENALLHGRLQSANSKKMLELKADGQRDDSDQLCKMEFRLDCDDVKLRGEAAKIVGEFPGLVRSNLDAEENKLTLYAKNIDTLPLQTKLKTICNASLVSFSMVRKKDEEKKDGRIVMDMVVARSSTVVAQNSTNNNGRSSEARININEAAFISFTSLGPSRCCGLF